MARGIVIGLAIGLATGWVLFGGDDPPRRKTREEMPAEPAKEARVEQPEAPEPDEPVRDPLPPDFPTGLSISNGPNGEKQYVMGGRRIEPRPLDGIDASLARARREKNWPEFFACLLEYAVLDTPEADRRLVDVMADSSLHLQGPFIGDRFLEALSDSGIEGIAEAARARAVVEIQEKKGSRWAGRGFLGLVAKYGDERDLAWLETLRTGRNRSREVDRALAQGAANPLAAERLSESLAGTNRLSFVPWREFAQASPEAAFRCAARMVEDGHPDPRKYRFLGTATTAGTLERARQLLAGAESDRDRLSALQAVDMFRHNELDTSGFDDVVDAPRRILQRPPTTKKEERLARSAIRAIERNRVAWTPANLDALRAAGESPNEKLAEEAREALEDIERNRAEAGGWEPERAD